MSTSKKDQPSEPKADVTASFRLACLEMLNPKTFAADVPAWIEKASQLEHYVLNGADTAKAPDENVVSINANQTHGDKGKPPSSVA